METNLVVEGLKFMILGMGTVFLFLIVMILMMELQKRIIQRLFPEPSTVAPTAPAKQTQQSKNNKVAAIVAAIIEDKKKNS